MQTVTLSLLSIRFAAARLWVLGQMARRGWLRACPRIGFWKLCGSGVGEGFTPVPNTAVWAILATWPDEATRATRTRRAGLPPLARPCRGTWTMFLDPSSARGHGPA
jgi:spheroidene monooxygenase